MGKLIEMTGSDKPFLPGSQKYITELEQISPSEKAMCVPYALLWEINATTGEPIHGDGHGQPKAPLSMKLVSPPSFGSSVASSNYFEDEKPRFFERPSVSLERIVIKSRNPMGMISFKEIELSFVVHKPEVLFEDHIDIQAGSDGKISSYKHKGDADSWSSFLYLGQCFALRYGWNSSSGVKNGALGGQGQDGTLNLPSENQISFIVSNYDFQIQPDNQIKINIKGFENGELNLRRAFIIPKQKSVNGVPVKSFLYDEGVADPYDKDSGGIQYIKNLIKNIEGKASKKSSKVKTVKFRDIMNIVFLPVLESTFAESGFEFEGVFVSQFNDRCGKPAPIYSNNEKLSDKSILEFEFPLDMIEKLFTDLINTGTQLTVYNFLKPFLDKMQDFSVWDRSNVKGEQKSEDKGIIPNVIARTLIQRKEKNSSQDYKLKVRFLIFDAKREYSGKVKDNKTSYPDGIRSKQQLIEKIAAADVPFISLMKGNSYIQNTSFNVVQDEQMKSIFMRKALGGQDITREDKTAKSSTSRKENKFPVMQQLFSPTIQGEITMIGNFGFDIFNLIWVDFGVRQWSGFFNILEKTDTIEQGSFTTSVKIYSTGDDPFNTKSFIKQTI